jgi:hypothetical protein
MYNFPEELEYAGSATLSDAGVAVISEYFSWNDGIGHFLSFFKMLHH